MKTVLVQTISAALLVVSLAACSRAPTTAPAVGAPSTDVNPITGSRGGSGAK